MSLSTITLSAYGGCSSKRRSTYLGFFQKKAIKLIGGSALFSKLLLLAHHQTVDNLSTGISIAFALKSSRPQFSPFANPGRSRTICSLEHTLYMIIKLINKNRNNN